MPADDRPTEPNSEGGAPPVPLNVVAQAAAAVEGNAEENQAAGGDPPPPTQAPPQDPTSDPPPAYGDDYHEIYNNDTSVGVDTKARVRQDGRIDINITQRSRRLTTIFAPALQTQLQQAHREQEPLPPAYIPPSLGGEPGKQPPPPLNVVIHVVGSRGDVQPFVALGKVLKETYGHRVRLATHPTFQQFVLENGLEFFSIGGDPAELMAFMVKNPGLMPGFDTLRSGDVGKRRKEIAQMVKGCWRSCIETGDGTGVEVTDDTVEDWMSTSTSNSGRTQADHLHQPFIADAIIANPPSFAHVHCAEKLGCPLHIMFTMPYSPTQSFPHPLANIQSSNADPSITNFMSYTLVDMMTWQGLGDIVNRFRQNSLGLEPVSLIWAPGMLARLRVPHTYCWSPALIPKPKDWANHISISGFYFLSLASNYTPDPELAMFLDNGPPPVYIGFGSIVVDDPTAMTKMIFDAVRKTGQRALVSKGWGGIGADQLGIPEGVMMLGNVPHDWLFKRVSCVVHHGGAGTTAAGIALGKPTVIVPFFGDQPFWGAMVAKAGAGPEPIAYKDLDADKLANSIMTALKPDSLERAKELAAGISTEHGCQTGAQSFHQQMNVDSVRCSLAPSRVAVWRLKRTKVRLSALAATVLGNEGLLDFKDLKLFRSQEYETDTGPLDPVTGGASAIIGTASTMLMGFADFPVEALKAMKVHPETRKKGKEKEKTSPGTSTGGDGEASGQLTPRHSTDNASTDNVSLTETKSSDGASMLSQESRPLSPPTTETSQSQFNLSESLSRLQSHDSSSSPSRPGNTSQGSQGSSMRLALRDQLNSEFVRRTSDQQQEKQTRSRSRRRSQSPFRRDTGDKVDTVIGTGKGVSRILDASFRSPMDFSHALAKGFHNAPKLYGDETVRKSEPITDFRTGIKAATKEFGYGLYDGITGLVTQPISGAKKEGAAGFIKGVGKGIGGVVLKPQAAIFGIPGYMMKGVYKELQGVWGSSVQNYIIAARTAQGFEDWHTSTPEERADIVDRWTLLQANLKRKKTVDEILCEWGQNQKGKSDVRRAERRRKIKEHLDKTDFQSFIRKQHAIKAGNANDSTAGPIQHSVSSPTTAGGRGRNEQQRHSISHSPASTPSDVDVLTPASSIDEPRDSYHMQHAHTFPSTASPSEVSRAAGDGTSAAPQQLHRRHHSSSTSTAHPHPNRHPTEDAAADTDEDEDLEAAIRLSLSQASTGDAADDEALERAIRASVAELEEQSALDHARSEEEEGRAIEKAMQASLKEWERLKGRAKTGTIAGPVGGPEGREGAGAGGGKAGKGGRKEWEGQESGVVPAGGPPGYEEVQGEGVSGGHGGSAGEAGHGGDDEDRMRSAIQASLADEESRKREKTEEEIVMEYVKKQSLMEEELRRKAREGGGAGVGNSGGEGSSAGGA